MTQSNADISALLSLDLDLGSGIFAQLSNLDLSEDAQGNVADTSALLKPDDHGIPR